ncbi:class I SAM-dependent methyltransferase [Formosa algae]|jgi:SAM-dependent methyltransferase|uniref:class I SAM-dependent methyltransferase n=1 Tax=Formosa algae TaxID=225843 RepID=UPI000CCF31C5|nr:class I SAM-dependent methyltransferase [Formosa algae]PNW29017.1 methyltransferase [Formosa algae]
MKNTPLEFWDARYAEDDFAYGTQPNTFFKSTLDSLPTGTVLLPAEGEGRNAVYAASKGWTAHAFDISLKGKEKALQLANMKAVTIDYDISGVLEFQTDKTFDAIALCYTHFPADIRKQAHQHILKFLKQGGTLIFECFAKAQLQYSSGGPKNEDMLFSIEEIKAEFKGLKFTLLEEQTIELSEGSYHIGKAQVIRCIGVKI